MQKLLILLCLILMLFCSGCSEVETVSKNDVIINMPTDNTVNGYRTEEVSDSSKAQTSTESKTDTHTNSASQTTSTKTNTTVQYCANTNSKKFHLPDCGSVATVKEENRLYLSDRAELIALGYEPCKRCNP